MMGLPHYSLPELMNVDAQFCVIPYDSFDSPHKTTEACPREPRVDRKTLAPKRPYVLFEKKESKGESRCRSSAKQAESGTVNTYNCPGPAVARKCVDVKVGPRTLRILAEVALLRWNDHPVELAHAHEN